MTPSITVTPTPCFYPTSSFKMSVESTSEDHTHPLPSARSLSLEYSLWNDKTSMRLEQDNALESLQTSLNKFLSISSINKDKLVLQESAAKNNKKRMQTDSPRVKRSRYKASHPILKVIDNVPVIHHTCLPLINLIEEEDQAPISDPDLCNSPLFERNQYNDYSCKYQHVRNEMNGVSLICEESIQQVDLELSLVAEYYTDKESPKDMARQDSYFYYAFHQLVSPLPLLSEIYSS